MANYKPLGVPFDRKFRNDANENFKTIDTVAEKAKTDAATAIDTANKAKTESADAKTKVDSVQTQLNNIVIESGTSDAEVIQARGAAPVLNERLNGIDVQVSDNAQAIVSAHEDARGFAVTASSNEAPIICIARRTSVQSIPDQTAGGTTEVLWNAEDIDSDGMHVNTTTDSARMTIKKAGIYRLEASINWAGVNAGIREVLIYKNGAALERTTMTVNQSSNVTAQVSATDVANVGDYYTIRVRQTSGGNLDIQTSISKFSALRIGTAVGPRGGIKFESSFAYRGISMYPNTILPERVFIQSDPVRGTSRQVARIHTRSIDNEVLYPRVQLATNSILAVGDEFYVGFGVYIPEDFEVIDGPDNDVMLHEIYGPPFNGGAPNSLRIFGNNFALFPDIDSYPTPQWTMPIIKGAWVDFVFRYKLSTDPAVGYVELSVNKGTGFENQLINGVQRYYHATLKAGVNDSGSNYSTIKVAYDAQSVRDEVTILFANHRIGYDTFNSVDPGSYA
ncbi:heparin lyase I family protein [Metabacillus sp. Hm71]|uniref:heparin lyase I family protein n=1 Tax=Metabacillus sp. Hm71 TaxID=3450743 RepID=UPI003F4257CE